MCIGASFHNCYHNDTTVLWYHGQLLHDNMDIRGRRTLYSSAIAVFLLIAPVLLLYSQGYRYDIGTRSILHIGAISIDSMPRGAAISIDGVDIRRTTPALISNTYPGTYHVVLTKQGYQPWAIDTTVIPSNTSPLNATMLPAFTTGHVTTDIQILAVAPSSMNRKIAIAYGSSDAMTLGIFSFDTMTIAPITRYSIDPVDPIQLVWSPHGKYIAANQSGSMLRIVDTSSNRQVFANSTRQLNEVLWDPVNDNIAYAIGDGSLWEIDLLKNTLRVVASPHIVTAAFDGSTLWMLRNNSTGSVLERLGATASDQGRWTKAIPSTSITRIYFQSGRCILLASEAVYLFGIPEGDLATISIPEVGSVYVAPNRNDALLSSASEIWTLDLSTSDASLVVRLSNVQSTAWFPNREAVVVLSKDTLRIHDIILRSNQAGQLGPFDRARSVIVIDDRTIAVISASSIDVITY